MNRPARGMVAAALVACAAASGAHAQRSELVPAGFGSLRRDDVAIQLQIQGLGVTAIPLDESVIRALAPDVYRALHALREGKSRELEALRKRLGLATVQAWHVMFSNLEPGEARFDPTDFLVRSTGRDFRPLEVYGLKPGFGDGRLAQRASQDAIYAFDPQVDLTQPLTVRIGTRQSEGWSEVVQRLERERALIWSRAAGAASKKP